MKIKIKIYTKEKIYYFNSTSNKIFFNILEQAHRENAPAVIWYYENGNISNETWYTNGKLHREDGPAVINYFENGKIKYKEYHLNHKYYSKIEFNKEILKKKFQLI